MQPGTAATWSRRAMALVLVVFMGLAFAANVINPLHEATDELRHYRFVQTIVQHKALPVQGVGCNAQGHHPPLFYAVAALATGWVDTTGEGDCYDPPPNPFWAYRYWEVGRDNKNQYLHYTAVEGFPWHGGALAAHLTRLVNSLFGAAAVWLTYLIGLAIWPKRPFLAVAGAALVGFNPMFVYMSGSVNNDVIAAFSGAAITLACVRLVQDERGLSLRWGLILGVLYSLALLSKFNLAAIAGLIGAAMTWVAWHKRQWRAWVQAGLALMGVTAVLTGWWFGRNQILYGEPTGVEKLTELWGVRDPSQSFWLAVSELDYVWTSLWGRFGYGQIPLPNVMYAGLGALAILGVTGYALPFVRRETQELKETAVPLLLLLLNVLLFLGVLFNYLLISPAGPMGRFFFPALPALAVLLAYGLSQYGATGQRPFRADVWLAGILNGGMALLTLIAFWGYLRPAYAQPPGFTPTAVPNPINAQFDSFVNLRGYELRQNEVRPGETLDLDLYWEVTAKPPGDYLLFVHLIDENGLMVAQRDTHPGLGNFPASNWQAGDRFVESIRLVVPETAYTPDNATLYVGYVAPGAYRLGISREGVGLGDALPLAEIAITPIPGDLPNAQNQNFNNRLRLRGYEYNKRSFLPGDVLAVTLYWERLSGDPADNWVRISVVDGEGKEVIYQESQPPAEGQPGEVIRDEHWLDLGYSLAAGAYTIHVTLMDVVSGQVQTIVADDGRQINDHLSLAQIRLQQ
ncbi:MAG: phospholipid carrier-dependent glycosyltransferase [Chloroflexi bacterium]|nr:phospholipid carrier-dependent glycosyltransferase [Chloroflexota bacterium]